MLLLHRCGSSSVEEGDVAVVVACGKELEQFRVVFHSNNLLHHTGVVGV